MKILCFGDSNVVGYNGSYPFNSSESHYLGGWRNPLHLALNANGIAHEFVGESTEFGAPPHMGYSGYCIDGTNCGLGSLSWKVDALAQYAPDVILFLAGFNDARNGDDAYTIQIKIKGVFRKIRRLLPSADIVHLGYPNVDPQSTTGEPSAIQINKTLHCVNKYIERYAARSARRIHTVDLSNSLAAGDWDSSHYGWHFNVSGHAKIAFEISGWFVNRSW